MKIRTRLRILCSVIFTLVFAVISVLTYSIFLRSSQRTVSANLEHSAYITAFFFLEEDELSAAEFEPIRRQFEENIPASSFQIYNIDNTIAWGSTGLDIGADLLEEIRSKGRLAFKRDGKFCFGIFYEDNQGDFVVIAMEDGDALEAPLKSLLWILFFCFLLGFALIVVLSGWVAKRAYEPFKITTAQIREISVGSLKDSRLDVPETDDELQALIKTFNELLGKLAESFIIQKNFVKYVSHEFRTPLASMMMNLEVFLLKERSAEESKQLAGNLVNRVKELEEILDTLMIVSELRKEAPSDEFIRIDELIWEIIGKISEVYPWARISVNTNITPEEEETLSVNTDRVQILTALYNIIENGVKFSKPHPVDISIFNDGDILHLTVTDKGIGIPEKELSKISVPFTRGENAEGIQGSGIGLSLALRILEKNNIEYKIDSKINLGTKITLYWKVNKLSR